MHIVLGVAVLLVAALIIRPGRPRRVSHLTDVELEAWAKRDRLEWFEKERQAKEAARSYPYGRGGLSALYDDATPGSSEGA